MADKDMKAKKNQIIKVLKLLNDLPGVTVLDENQDGSTIWVANTSKRTPDLELVWDEKTNRYCVYILQQETILDAKKRLSWVPICEIRSRLKANKLVLFYQFLVAEG